MKYQCLYDFLKQEGYGRSTIKKISNAYFDGRKNELKPYEQRSLCHWIVTERIKGSL